MHIQALLILALSASILSLSLPTTTPSPLEARWSRGWIASFNNSDTTCSDPNVQNDQNGHRPTLTKGQCTTFSPSTQRVGIDWGAGEFHFTKVEGFEGSDCTGGVQATLETKTVARGYCSLLSDLGCQGGEDVGNACFWQSVKAS